jgi:hypothetical protein
LALKEGVLFCQGVVNDRSNFAWSKVLFWGVLAVEMRATEVCDAMALHVQV